MCSQACYLHTKSALTFLGGTNSIIQVESDSILLCSGVYKFVTTNRFNCYDTIACIYNFFKIQENGMFSLML